jgi:hypothetical protein
MTDSDVKESDFVFYRKNPNQFLELSPDQKKSLITRWQNNFPLFKWSWEWSSLPVFDVLAHYPDLEGLSKYDLARNLPARHITNVTEVRDFLQTDISRYPSHWDFLFTWFLESSIEDEKTDQKFYHFLLTGVKPEQPIRLEYLFQLLTKYLNSQTFRTKQQKEAMIEAFFEIPFPKNETYDDSDLKQLFSLLVHQNHLLPKKIISLVLQRYIMLFPIDQLLLFFYPLVDWNNSKTMESLVQFRNTDQTRLEALSKLWERAFFLTFHKIIDADDSFFRLVVDKGDKLTNSEMGGLTDAAQNFKVFSSYGLTLVTENAKVQFLTEKLFNGKADFFCSLNFFHCFHSIIKKIQTDDSFINHINYTLVQLLLQETGLILFFEDVKSFKGDDFQRLLNEKLLKPNSTHVILSALFFLLEKFPQLENQVSFLQFFQSYITIDFTIAKNMTDFTNWLIHNMFFPLTSPLAKKWMLSLIEMRVDYIRQQLHQGFMYAAVVLSGNPAIWTSWINYCPYDDPYLETVFLLYSPSSLFESWNSLCQQRKNAFRAWLSFQNRKIVFEKQWSSDSVLHVQTFQLIQGYLEANLHDNPADYYHRFFKKVLKKEKDVPKLWRRVLVDSNENWDEPQNAYCAYVKSGQVKTDWSNFTHPDMKMLIQGLQNLCLANRHFSHRDVSAMSLWLLSALVETPHETKEKQKPDVWLDVLSDTYPDVRVNLQQWIQEKVSFDKLESYFLTLEKKEMESNGKEKSSLLLEAIWFLLFVVRNLHQNKKLFQEFQREHKRKRPSSFLSSSSSSSSSSSVNVQEKEQDKKKRRLS